MSAQSPLPSPDRPAATIDTSVAHPARVYEFFLGGTNNFPVDREAAQRMGSALPGGVDAIRVLARSNRDFLLRAARYLSVEAGLRQFLDLGSGIPTSNRDNVHDVVHDVAPEARIVFVDNDPIVLEHADQVLDSSSGNARFILADLRDVDDVLRQASQDMVDLSRPVALLIVGVFHVVEDDPKPILDRYVDALAPGSHVAVSNIAADIEPEHTVEMARRYGEVATTAMVPRSVDEMSGLLDGLELVEPGIVPAVQWHNPERDGQAPVPPMWAAVARKP